MDKRASSVQSRRADRIRPATPDDGIETHPTPPPPPPPQQSDHQPGRENWMLDNGRSRLPGFPEEADKDSLNDNRSAEGSLHFPRGRTANNILGLLSASESYQHTDPYCFLWIVLSSMYGQLLIILMISFTLIEVMDNSVKLLSLQGIYLMYLYIGSIAVIICIYIWVLIDSCASFRSSSDESFSASVLGDAEIGRLSLTRFGSLKRAHISRNKTSTTSFYLRIGALAFGLGTLVFNGLEMAMHSMMDEHCLNDVVFVHPVLHGLFTFLQMHFLFVNSQVLVERFGLIARFGFMHLAATNLALWVRLVVWESGIEWTYFVYLIQSANTAPTSTSEFVNSQYIPAHFKGFPKVSSTLDRQERDVILRYNKSWRNEAYNPISDNQISQVVALHQCLNTNSLGQLWMSSMPFLYPFIVQFSLIAAGVTFVMGQNVGKDRMKRVRPVYKRHSINNNNNNITSNVKNCPSNCNIDAHYRRSHIDCTGASKGLFLGLLCLVASIVVIIIFLVVKEDDGFPVESLFWITTGTQGIILLLSLLMTMPGLVQIRKLSYTDKCPTMLDSLLVTITLSGVQLYSVFGIVVAASSLYVAVPHSIEQRQYIMLLTVSSLQLLQAACQSTLIEEGLRRGAVTRHQHLTTPARQVVTFLLCSNAALWATDSFITQNWLSQELQLRFMGVLAWGVVSRIALPLLVFYRFHSGILLLEIWQRAYNSNKLDSSG